ncbi:MAG: 4'-phosphopantetheinyl transferase superfamily protein [Clostridia bacterium]|nr:4'-phosphopantetheinyl transferase superfamily protein [Clostridia bacterium]
MVIVFVRKIENLPDAEKQNIISSLSSSALKRLESKRNKRLYNASLCALSLLSDMQRAALDYADGGRPFFKDLDTDISISHSASYTAVALSQSAQSPVGVDIEDAIEKSPSTRFLTENERLALEGGTPYLNIWTKKEALFKFLKNDSTPFIHLDSTAPELHGAKFVTVAVDSAILTVCAKPHELIKIIEK